MNINAEGIVLRQRKIAGGRRIIVIFTKQYGKLSAGTSINEKGRSKAALALRPFTYAEYDIFKGREAYSINSASVLRSYYSIGEEINRYMIASAFLTYLERVLDEGVPMPGLFKLSIEFLESVSEAGKSADTMFYAFIVKTLRMLGVMPEITCCVNCGRRLEEIAKPRRFSVSSGGIICSDCAEEEQKSGSSLIYRPSFDIIEVLRYLESKTLATFKKVDLKEDDAKQFREILSKYTEQYLDTDVLGSLRGPEV